MFIMAHIQFNTVKSGLPYSIEYIPYYDYISLLYLYFRVQDVSSSSTMLKDRIKRLKTAVIEKKREQIESEREIKRLNTVIGEFRSRVMNLEERLSRKTRDST